MRRTAWTEAKPEYLPLGGPGVDEDRIYSDEATDFMQAMDRYKRVNQRPFPAWSEVLAVVHSLGYRRVAPATHLPRKP